MDRLNEGACCSSYDDEQSHYRAHEDDGRFGEFAHRALRRLFAHLSVSSARIRLPTPREPERPAAFGIVRPMANGAGTAGDNLARARFLPHGRFVAERRHPAQYGTARQKNQPATLGNVHKAR